jgi:SpoVK/Ycf46/Vps4 family AAA+-type ATPase
MILGGEINTLLTEIEKTEGIVILATNRIENLDAALERRISLIVEFPEPTFEQRQVIWEKTIPKKMPLNKDVKLDKLSEYKLTGGQIKNAVLQAARLALAEDAKAVNEQHFENAIKRINKSKNLMGTASRYEQVSVKTGKVKSPGFSK